MRLEAGYGEAEAAARGGERGVGAVTVAALEAVALDVVLGRGRMRAGSPGWADQGIRGSPISWAEASSNGQIQSIMTLFAESRDAST